MQANRFGFGLPVSEIGFNVILMIEIVGNRSVDLPKRQRREAILDLFGRCAFLEDCDQRIEGYPGTSYFARFRSDPVAAVLFG